MTEQKIIPCGAEIHKSLLSKIGKPDSICTGYLLPCKETQGTVIHIDEIDTGWTREYWKCSQCGREVK